MMRQIELGLYVFVLASFPIGFEVIHRVPPLLHTPLMSLTNAISGISLRRSLLLTVVTGRGTIAVGWSIAVTRLHDQRGRRLP